MVSLEMRLAGGDHAAKIGAARQASANDNPSHDQLMFERIVSRELVDDID